MLSLYHLNVDGLLVLSFPFRFVYFWFWYFGYKILGTIHVYTKFGLVSLGLFWSLVWFSRKFENQLICKKKKKLGPTRTELDPNLNLI